MSVFKLLFVLFPFGVCVELGTRWRPTKGEVWPKSQSELKTHTFYIFESGNGVFQVKKPYHTCDILEKGIIRLLQLNFVRKQEYLREKTTKLMNYDKYFRGFYGSNTEFRIELTSECENYPHLDMDEEYKLTVGDVIVLASASIWGILRGMETFNHLVYYSEDYTEIRINTTTIQDFPAYPHRGLLIDTGRQYLQPETIHLIINAMEMNKMNVLHWHIVDDESFPFQSERLPDLSKKGAFHPSMVYTKKVIEDIIERARLAGIRVIPEFDAPGHVRSWGAAYPDILTECYDDRYEVVALGPLDPISNTTHAVLEQLYQEVTEVFKDEYIHLGGDEVDTKCWLSNVNIEAFRKKHHINSIARVLQAEFFNTVISMLPKSKYILWQDMFDAKIPLHNKTVVQVWDSEFKLAPDKEMVEILKSGQRVLFSAAWYLDSVSKTCEMFYSADPRLMVVNESRTYENISEEKLDDIIGGEACMWGEMVDETNIFSRIWPRASAVAERLWTGTDLDSVGQINVTNYTRRRIEEHACRMRHNDIPAEPPNGPGFCIGPGLK